MKYAIFITGSAGSGKSTATLLLSQHYDLLHRRNVLFNLDPACDYIPYEPELDIRELITNLEVQQAMNMGPNGALIYAFTYFFENENQYLSENTNFEDDFLIFDCPGQIELYIQHNELAKFANQLQRKGYECVCLYLIDSNKVITPENLLTNLLISHCVEVSMGLPFQMVFTKSDIVSPQTIENFINEQETIQEQLLPFYQRIYEKTINKIGNVMFLSHDNEELITGVQQIIDFMTHYKENE